MAIEYLGLREINGPLVVLEGVENAAFDEIVEFKMNDGNEKRLGRIIEIFTTDRWKPVNWFSNTVESSS